MFLTVHSAVGLTIGQYVKNPLLAFLAGLGFHYIFDIIPHGDTQISKKYYNVVYITLAGLFDLALTISFLLLFMIMTGQLLTWAQILAIVGSLLPDALQFLYFLYPQNPTLKFCQKIHHYFHSLIAKNFELSLRAGMSLQLLLFIIFLLFNI